MFILFFCLQDINQFWKLLIYSRIFKKESIFHSVVEYKHLHHVTALHHVKKFVMLPYSMTFTENGPYCISVIFMQRLRPYIVNHDMFNYVEHP